MLDIYIIPKRHGNFWDGVNQARVEEYRNELNEAKAELERLSWVQQKLLETNDKRIEELKGLVNDELELCDFYSEYIVRQQEENFDKWFYVKREDREKVLHEQWGVKGDCWIKHNGKIRTIIAFDTTRMMTKISLVVENDSDKIVFVGGSYGNSRQEIVYSHLKNQKSIEERVKEYKQKAEELMKNYQYPYYCMESRNFQILGQLLHVEDK